MRRKQQSAAKDGEGSRAQQRQQRSGSAPGAGSGDGSETTRSGSGGSEGPGIGDEPGAALSLDAAADTAAAALPAPPHPTLKLPLVELAPKLVMSSDDLHELLEFEEMLMAPGEAPTLLRRADASPGLRQAAAPPQQQQQPSPPHLILQQQQQQQQQVQPPPPQPHPHPYQSPLASVAVRPPPAPAQPLAQQAAGHSWSVVDVSLKVRPGRVGVPACVGAWFDT